MSFKSRSSLYVQLNSYSWLSNVCFFENIWVFYIISTVISWTFLCDYPYTMYSAKKVKNKAEISINKLSWSSCLIYNVLKIFNFSSNNKWIRHVCFNMSHIWDKIQGAIDMFLIFLWNAPYVNVLPPGNKMVSWE